MGRGVAVPHAMRKTRQSEVRLPRIMVVCTGNICRSPMGQVVFARALARAGVPAIVESAGTSDEEAGHPIDLRARDALEERDYEVPEHGARLVTAGDLAERDLVLAMTHGHFRSLERLAARSGAAIEIRMVREFDPAFAGQVPSPRLDIDDPWWGTRPDFIQALDEIEAAAAGIVAWARAWRLRG